MSDTTVIRRLGEPPCISSTPAIVAAIRDAVGVDVTRVPVRPQDLCLVPGTEPGTEPS